MLKLSGFGDEIHENFEIQLREMRKMDINFIALRNLWGTNVLDLNRRQKKDARDLLRKYGMGVSEIGSPLGKVLITSSWKKEWARYMKAVEMAKYFNCPRIRIFSFYFPKGREPEEFRSAVIKRLREMADYAEENDIMLLHENESNIYGDTGLRCKDLAESVNSPNFKLIFDPANYVFCGTKAFSQWFDMQKEHVTHLHIKDCCFDRTFTTAGKGDGEFPELIRTLVDQGFSGFATMEPHLAHGGQFAGFSGPENFANATSEFRKLCKKEGMETRQVRVGVVGMGFIGKFHCDAIQDVPQAHLVAVADSKKVPNLQKAEDEYNIAAYSNVNRLLKRNDIDAITLGTPSGLHADIAVQAAEYKKHVLTEKPVEITLEKADAMINACKKNKVKLGVVSQRRWDDGMKELKQAVDEGALGKLIQGEAYVKWFRTQEYYDGGAWRGTWDIDGGGCLMNQGVHTVDCFQWVMGPVVSVTAQTACLAHDRIEVEDVAYAMLKFKNGAMGAIIASTAAYPGMDERIEVTGTNGTMIMNKSSITMREIRGEKSVQDDEAVERGSGAADPQAITNEGHVAQIKDFCEAILNNRKPMIDGSEGRLPLEIILAIYESAKTGKTVKLPLKPKGKTRAKKKTSRNK
ncbi:Gfo/Idh/MocA family oxidoreductase [bacterium]|nr:Gfo/Idh/MocA family oxidoreductase [bacterium]